MTSLIKKSSMFGTCLMMMSVSVGLSACSRDPDLYRLAAVPGSTFLSQRRVVEVRTPVVDASLDRDEIVRQTKDYRVHLARGAAWAEPISVMIGQTMAQDLRNRLPGTTVFAQNDAVSTEPSAYVELTITSLNENQNGFATLQGTLAVHPHEPLLGAVLTTPFRFTSSRKVSGRTDRLVAALSDEIGKLADLAAQHIHDLPTTRR